VLACAAVFELPVLHMLFTRSHGTCCHAVQQQQELPGQNSTAALPYLITHTYTHKHTHAATATTAALANAPSQAGYLFPEIGRRRNAYLAANPDGRAIISLGIGDTTQPIPEHILGGLIKGVGGLPICILMYTSCLCTY
jgi:hypothetical protein